MLKDVIGTNIMYGIVIPRPAFFKICRNIYTIEFVYININPATKSILIAAQVKFYPFIW